MAKKQKQHEHVNHERWLVSYADFITLLFAFFVIMYALSEVDKNKLKKFSKSVQFAFSHVGTGGTQQMGKTPAQKKPTVIGDAWPKGQRQSDPGPYDNLQGIVRFLEKSIARYFVKEERAKAEIIDDGKSVIVRIPVERLFAPSGATLRADRMRFLEDFGQALRTYKVELQVTMTIEIPFGDDELEEHALGARRNDALVRAVWRANVVERASFSTRVVMQEFPEVEASKAERARAVVEFRVTM